MSKKRRGFDIDLETDDAFDTDTDRPVSDSIDPVPQRRGPMATAITETAGSLRDRAVIEAQIRTENDALAHEHVRLKKLGLITGLIALDLIDTSKLTRDRAKGDDPELAELIASVREIGLSNPIRVEQQPDGRFELLQGFRRLSAFRALLADTADPARYGSIPATIIPRGTALEQLYRQMVDENLVRKDISFAEMAQMAVNYAADPGTAENDPEKVVARLFASAGYAKRSYIRSFITLVELLGEDLQFANEIPRALGLAVAHRLQVEPETARLIRAELATWTNRSVPEELDVLRRYSRPPRLVPGPGDDYAPDGTGDFTAGFGPGGFGPGGFGPGGFGPGSARPKGYDFGPSLAGPDKTPGLAGGSAGGAAPESASVSFQLPSRWGPVRCTATAGRIDLRMARDLSRIDRRTLESAIQMLLDRLG